MRWNFWATSVAALLGSVSVADATTYFDSETGFTFTSTDILYALGRTLTIRIAVPTPVSPNTSYDAVLQVVAPIGVGWAGVAWGGGMTFNPLAVGWQNSNQAIVSSRWATIHASPSIYTGATYQLFRTGNRVNGTHWQYTAKCTGCTYYVGSNSRQIILNPTGTNRLAWAYSPLKPATPSSTSSVIQAHESYNYITPNFAEGQNANFAALVIRNT